MSMLEGRDWTIWEQIDNILGLALNRATTAYLNALDNAPDSARAWQEVAHDISVVKQVTGAHVANADEVPPDISERDIYSQIDSALEPFAMSGELQDAISELPFIASNPIHEIAVAEARKNSWFLPVAGMVAGAGLLYGLYRWARGK